jgi:hypothetical protein
MTEVTSQKTNKPNRSSATTMPTIDPASERHRALPVG